MPDLDPVTPTFPISRFVEDIRAYAPVAGRAHNVERLPDGRTVLVFRLMESGTTDVSVMGPRTRALFKSPVGVVRTAGVQLKPGWSRALLGVAASELTDRIVPLEDVWGLPARELCLDLAAAPTLQDLVDRLTRAIVIRARQTFEPASGQLARRAVRLIEEGEDRVERVASRLGVSARHLRRAFTESIGIGPKEFARAVRLQRAVRGMSVTHDHARVAADAGYYDQAHLIADFRQLVGLTPGAFLRRANAPVTRHASKDVAAA